MKALSAKGNPFYPDSSQTLPEDIQDMVVLVHDGARPWVSQGLAERVAAVADESAPACPSPSHRNPEGDQPGRNRGPPPFPTTLATAQPPRYFRLGPLLPRIAKPWRRTWTARTTRKLWARYNGPVDDGGRASQSQDHVSEDLYCTPKRPFEG